MPLSQDTLKDALRRFMDPTYVKLARDEAGNVVKDEEGNDVVLESFEGYPDSSVATGLSWAGALSRYFSELTVPAGVTELHCTTAAAAFAPLFQPDPALGNALVLLPAALTAYTASLATLPTPLAVATLPPPAPLLLALADTSVTAEEAADIIATTIDTWARTGTFTAPGVAPVPWS